MSLLDNGIIDSVGVMELVAFLEQDHGLTIDDQDLVPENLDSVDNLVRLRLAQARGGLTHGRLTPVHALLEASADRRGDGDRAGARRRPS